MKWKLTNFGLSFHSLFLGHAKDWTRHTQEQKEEIDKRYEKRPSVESKIEEKYESTTISYTHDNKSDWK